MTRPRMGRRFISGVTAGIGLIVLSLPAAHAAVIIDDFETPNVTSLELPATSTGTISEETPEGAGNDIIGGFRDTFVEVVQPVNPNVGGDFSAFSSAGTFSVNSPSGAGSAGFQGRAVVTWDGQDNDITPTGVATTGLGSVDLTENGVNDRFQIAFPFSDAFNTDFTLSVWDGTGVRQDVTKGVPNTQLAQLSGQPVFFSEFANVDLMNVGALQLSFNSVPRGADFDVELIATTTSIPSPATLGLLGAGLIALGAVARRSARRQTTTV